jgi:soluble lytic murein transglycosylase-like protein
MRQLGLLLCLAGSAWAGEYAVLTSGARLYCVRHELDGQKLRLHTKSGGFSEIEAALVARFEVEEYVPTPPAPPPAAAPDPAPAPVVRDPKQLADEAADKYGLPRQLVRSVVKAESAFQAHVVSPKGAIGLMQLMPGTARDLGADPHDPAQNVDAGTRYLRDLLLKYDGGLHHALAAYNAGPGAVAKYKGVPPYRETVGYIQRIVKDSGIKTSEPPASTPR